MRFPLLPGIVDKPFSPEEGDFFLVRGAFSDKPLLLVGGVFKEAWRISPVLLLYGLLYSGPVVAIVATLTDESP